MLFVLALVFATVAVLAQTDSAATEKTLLQELRKVMRLKDYKKAIEVADKAVGITKSQKDYFLYMKALSQFYLGATGDSEKTLREVLQFTESAWKSKGIFLQARIHLKNKDYAAAEKIYAKESFRLHGEKRKEQVAKIYIQFAEALSKEPLPEELDAPKPDYHKAYALYQKALELKPSDSLTEELTFRLGKTKFQARDWYQTKHDLQQYLSQYDKDWQGLPGEPQEPKSLVKGKHWEEARYLVAQCFMEEQQYASAREVLEDLVRLIRGKNMALSMKSLWQITRTYRLPRPSSAEELTSAVSALRLYLQEFPESLYSVQAAYEIGSAYMHWNRTEEAIAAIQDFLASKGYKVQQNATVETGQETPLQMHERLRKEATYNLGKLYAGQKFYAKAIGIWQQYTAQFPDGPHWSSSQQGILDCEYQIGEDLVAAKKYEEARSVWDRFMAKYPLDTRIYRILYTFGSIKHQLGVAAKKTKDGKPTDLFLQAISEWEKLISKYPGSQEAQVALYMVARIYEEELGDLKKALTTYQKISSGRYYSEGQERIRKMTAKSLAISTERIYRTDEAAKIKVQTRNIKKLSVSMYRLNLEEYFRKERTIRNIEKLDLALIEPDKLWEVPIAQYADYLPMEQEIPIAMQGAGVYAVHVSDGEQEGTTLILRTDLDFILKSSRREVLVYVQNMREKKPESGVRVLVSDGEKIVLQGSTNREGVFLEKCDALKDMKQVSAFVEKEGHVASNLTSLEGLGFSLGLSPKGYIFTDRPAYRPGEKVHIRAIVRDVVSGAYIVPQMTSCHVSIFDPAGRCLSTEEAKLSSFGTLSTSFSLSEGAHIGLYRVELVRDKKHKFQGEFDVAHFLMPKVRLTLSFPHRVYFRGEVVEATFHASYYYGTPLSQKLLRYTLPDGRSFVGTTDTKGYLKVSFDTSRTTPGKALVFSGHLEAEDVKVTEQVFLARYGFSIQLSTHTKIMLAGESVELTLRTNDASGNPVGQELTLALYRQVSVSPDPVLASMPWKEHPTTQQGEVKVEEKKVATDSKTGVARVSFTMAAGGNYIFRAQGKDRFLNSVEGSTTLFVSDAEDKTKLRIFSERQHLKVGEMVDVKVHSRLEKGLALVTLEGETILRYQIVSMAEGFNDVKIAVGHEHFPNFQMNVSSMVGNHFYEARQEFTVEREMKLHLSFSQKQYRPGEKTKVAILTTDHLGKPVKAEVSLSLVDEALFSMYPDKRPPIVDFFQKGAKRVAEMRTQTSCIFAYQAIIKKVVQELEQEKKRISAGEKSEAPEEERDDRRVENAPKQEFAKLLDKMKEYPSAPKKKLYGYMYKNGKPRLYKQGVSKEEAPEEPEPSQPIARHEIAPLGWWTPSVITGEDGKAIEEITMPEKITRWRLTAIGCTVETLVGETKEETVTTKNFFVDVKLPMALREGDRPRILTRIHNLSDYVGPVSLTLEIEAGEERFVQPKQTHIGANQSSEFVFDEITIPSALRCQIKVIAQAKKLSDAVVQTIPVTPWGMEYASHQSGQANTSMTAFVALPQEHYLSRYMSVTIGPTLQRTILDLAGTGGDSRFGGGYISQASDLLAYAAVLEYVSKVRTIPGEYHAVFARCRAIAASLIASQKEDGGWGLFPGDHYAHPVVSARILIALAYAKKQGVEIQEKTISKASAHLKKAFASVHHTDNEKKALIQYALALVKESDFAYANRLYRQRGSMSSAGLAYTALLLASLDKKEMAGEVLHALQRHKVAHHEHSGLAPWSKQGNSSWTMSDKETTALVVLAFATVRPQSPIVEQGVRYLLRVGIWGFSPHHAKGTVLAALVSYFAHAKYSQSDYNLSILVNDQPVHTIRGKEDTPTATLEIPGKLIKNGRNRVEFRFQGNGTYTYSVTLRGFSPNIKDPKRWSYPYVHSRRYLHAPLEYKGKPIGVESTSHVSNLDLGQRTHVKVDFVTGSDSRTSQHFIVEEPIPAGAVVVKDTVKGYFSHYEIAPDRIFFYMAPDRSPGYLSYELIGYAPGTYRILPTVIRDAHDPSKMRVGQANYIAVLGPEEKSPDAYTKNTQELYTLGKLYFEDRQYRQSLELLQELVQKNPGYEQREVARMLLWIYTEPEHYDAQKTVDYFEILKERYAELYIPFDRILVVGRAYESIREYERAYLVFQATMEASFEEEAKVGGTLEDQGEFLGSVDYMRHLLREYHDSASVVQAFFGLSQAVYSKISKLDELRHNFRLKHKKRVTTPPTKEELLKDTIDILEEFLSLYPESPQADDASFSLALANLSLERFPEVIEIAQTSRRLYTDSDFISSFQYMEALGYFSLHEYEKAVHQASAVAEGTSKDKDFATYILGQIYHAQGNPPLSIAFYRRIQDKFPDAKEAISYFERRYIRLPEVTKILPTEKAEVEMQYCNIKEAQFLIYRVDLMKLYLLHKNLAGITKVHLSGIFPVFDQRIVLGQGKDYQNMKRMISLPLSGEGAYLVICRGDDLFTSGLILVTPLQIEVQEDADSGRVRANLLDIVKKTKPKGVHVKVVGSGKEALTSGDTDLRGLFIADNIRGKVTVIARHEKNRYAFYRGETWLGTQPDVAQPSREWQYQQRRESQQQKLHKMMESEEYDFRSNLEKSQRALQDTNINRLRSQMRRTYKGVQVEMAK
jgi:uncharacterized protein YfaS (alpha-2-macroglobulin family)/tetratricopeptide (TPR) repeat protein